MNLIMVLIGTACLLKQIASENLEDVLTETDLNRTALDASIVYLKPGHLSYMLEKNMDFTSTDQEITDQTFFQAFPRILLAFYESNENETGMNFMETIFDQVLKHNLKKKRTVNAENQESHKYLELLISIEPKGNKSTTTNIITRTLQNIVNVNSKFPGTVSTLLLNYNSLQLNAESVPLLREDSQILNALVKQHLGNSLEVGIVLDRNNCLGKFTEVKNLNLSAESTIVFLSQLQTDQTISPNFITTAACILYRTSDTKVKMSPELKVQIEVSVENGTYTFQPSDASSILDKYNGLSYATFISFIIKVKLLDPKPTQGSSADRHAAEVAWLKNPLIFDKSHFGVSTYLPTTPDILPQVLPQLFSSFSNIIVENVEFTEHSMAVLKAFVESAVAYNRAVKLHGRQLETSLDGRAPVQINIVVIISNERLSTDLKFTREIWKLSQNTNGKYPNTVNRILLKWLPCSKNGRKCDGYTYISFLEEVFSSVVTLQASRVKPQNSSIQEYPRFSIVWEHGLCLHYGNFYDIERLQNLLAEIHGSILRIRIDKTRLVEKGAEYIGAYIIEEVANCEIRLWPLQLKSGPILPIYIGIMGCTGHNSDVYEQTEIVKLWKLMHSWSVKQNRLVFMNRAFEYTEGTSEQRNVNCNSSIHFTAGDCGCGWWKVSKDNSQPGGMFKFEDRKSVALRMYENSSDDSPSVKLHNEYNNYQVIVLVLVPIMITVILIAIMVTVTVIILRHRSNHFMNKEVRDFFHGKTKPKSQNEFGELANGSETAESQPYNKKQLEIVPSSFNINKAKILGSGEFGLVYRGTVSRDNANVEIAVKMMKKLNKESSHGYNIALKGLVSEIKILSHVGCHVNIVQLIGAYTAKYKKGHVFVFLELCELGSVQKYLRSYSPIQERERASSNNVYTSQHDSVEMAARNPILSEEMIQDLHRWSREIASAMEFLASKKIVHADLATRNVLLNQEKIAKLSDFGLSRRLYNYTEYLKTEVGPLPWKWMAPESLQRMIFNESSDVWAFGVTLWEMFNLGDEPYSGLNWEVNFPAMLERGHRLPEPRYNTKDIYSVMKLCWDLVPAQRPTFTQVKAIFAETEEDR